jgi:hypothetical protein
MPHLRHQEARGFVISRLCLLDCGNSIGVGLGGRKEGRGAFMLIESASRILLASQDTHDP